MNLLFRAMSTVFLGLVCAGCSLAADSEPLTVYNNDDRVPLLNAGGDLARFAPTIAILAQKHRAPTPQNLQLNAPKFGSVFGMCSDEAFFEEKTVGDCTGFLVTNNLLLTAGHCVKDASSCSKRTIIFNFHVPNQPAVESRDLYFCKSVPARLPPNDGDLALIELDRDVELNPGQPFLEAHDFNSKTTESAQILSHPFGVSLKVSALESSPVQDGAFFYAQADVSGGSSGAPAFDPTTGRLAGVLISGEGDLAWDRSNQCNRHKVCENGACKGERFATTSSVQKLMNIYKSLRQ